MRWAKCYSVLKQTEKERQLGDGEKHWKSMQQIGQNAYSAILQKWSKNTWKQEWWHYSNYSKSDTFSFIFSISIYYSYTRGPKFKI